MNPLLHLNQRGVLCMTSLQFSRAFCVTTPNPLRVLSDLCARKRVPGMRDVSILKSKLLPPTQPLTNKRGVLSGLCVSSLQFLGGLYASILKSKLLPPTQPLTNKRGVLSGLCVSNP